LNQGFELVFGVWIKGALQNEVSRGDLLVVVVVLCIVVAGVGARSSSTALKPKSRLISKVP